MEIMQTVDDATIIKNVIKKLASEHLTAKFTRDMYGPKKGALPYGYFNLVSPALGPVMILLEYGNSPKNSRCQIQLQKSNTDLYAFKDNTPNSFQICADFLKTLKTEPSNITSLEAYDRFFHFLSPADKRQRCEQHYLNTRVMYDTMYQMMQVAPRDTKFVEINGGYTISAKIDGGIETISIRKVPVPTETNDLTNMISIDIPSVKLHDRFLFNSCQSDTFTYDKAQEYLDAAKGKQITNTGAAEFTRWDQGYRDMMQKIFNARSAKTKK